MGFLTTLSPWLMAGVANRSPMEQLPGVTPFAPDAQWGGGPTAGGVFLAQAQPPTTQQAQPRQQPASPFVAPPGFVTPTAAQPQQQPQRPQNLFTRVNERLGFEPMDWAQLGFSLMGNARGSNWTGVAQDLGAIRQTAQQRADRRLEREAWQEDRTWQRGERERTAQERAARDQRYQAALRSAQSSDPELYSVLQAVGPEGFSEIMSNERMTPYQRESVGLQRDQLRLALQEHSDTMRLGYARLNQDRMLNSTLAGLGRDEAAYVAGMRARLDTGRDVMPFVDELDQILQRRPEIFGAILEPDAETAIRKFATPGDQETIADIQRVWTIGADFAREELRGQTPISNLDLRVALQTGASTQQTAASMRRWIDAARRDYTRMEGQYQSALRYMQPGGANGPTRNLFEPDPSTGRNWYQDTYTNWSGQPGTGAPQSSGAGRTPTPEEARAELERRRSGGGFNNRPRRPLSEAGRQAIPSTSPLIPMGSMTIYQRQLWTEYQRSRNGPDGARRHWERRARAAGLIE